MSRSPFVATMQRSLRATFVIALFGASLGSPLLIAQDKETNTKNKSKQAKSQAAKTEAAKAEPSPTPKDDSAEENKGPWHGLTWRLVGPYRGGRVLAVSGVVGDTHTYYVGGVA